MNVNNLQRSAKGRRKPLEVRVACAAGNSSTEIAAKLRERLLRYKHDLSIYPLGLGLLFKKGRLERGEKREKTHEEAAREAGAHDLVFSTIPYKHAALMPEGFVDVVRTVGRYGRQVRDEMGVALEEKLSPEQEVEHKTRCILKFLEGEQLMERTTENG